ncbi:hypothetical protein EON63_15420 [archaeon]|nr:MAG: hypothetical protein EON63_15420 [archaeon]
MGMGAHTCPPVNTLSSQLLLPNARAAGQLFPKIAHKKKAPTVSIVQMVTMGYVVWCMMVIMWCMGFGDGMLYYA